MQATQRPGLDDKKRVPFADVLAAYNETQSVWRAGKMLGLSGQNVHYRLQAAGVRLSGARWSADEVEELRRLAGAVTVGEIANRLGRSYAGVACKLSDLGIDASGPARRARVKIPRGAGYDKVSLARYVREIDASGVPITRYAKAHALETEMLIQSIEKAFPDWWTAYRRAHSDLPEKACPTCHGVFVPSNGKQVYCNRRCAARKKVDDTYFGGKRHTTVGLAEGRCQLCGRRPDRGLSSHHVLGKDNDPDNETLIALCAGCHNIVTMLGGRDFDEVQWQSLIGLVWLRRNGHRIAADEFGDGGMLVCVEMEWQPMDEDDVEEATRGGGLS